MPTRDVRSIVAALGTCGVLLAAAVQPAAAQSFQPQQSAVVMRPDLTVNLVASPTQVSGGGDVTYTATVRNVGLLAFRDPLTLAPVYFNTPAKPIVVSQTLPAGVRFKSATGTLGFTCANVGSSVTCSGGNLQPEQTAAITTTVIAPFGPATLNSSVVVDPANTIAERDETNNSAAAAASVPLPDLSVELHPLLSQVDDGGANGYVVSINNAPGGAEANGVSFQLTLPPGTGYRDAYDGDRGYRLAGFTCSESGGVVTCNGAHIGAGGVGAATIEVWAPRMNGTVSPAVVVVDPNNSIAERDEANNTATATYFVFGRPDLAISTMFWPFVAPPLVQRVTTIQNLGAGPATNVEVRIVATTADPPPAPAGADDPISILADSGFSCTRQGNFPTGLYELSDVYSCTGGTIAAGGTATITTFHWMHYNSPERRTVADVDPWQAIREANEANNHAEVWRRLW